MAKKKKAKGAKKKSAVKKAKKKIVAKKKVAKKVKKAVAAKKSKTAIRKPASVPSHPAAYKPASNEKKVGEVEDYFSRISVIATKLKDAVSVGDTIHVHGHTTDLTQKVESMEIEHQKVQKAEKGDSVGIKVGDKCRKGDEIYRQK